MRKVYVEMRMEVILTVEDGVNIDETVGEIELTLSDDAPDATLSDYRIMDYEVVDSK